GQKDDASDDVAALAVLADHAREPRRCVGGARGDRGGVDGVVEDRADVVAHAAVDRDVDALAAVVEPDGLDGPDPVQGGDGGSDERTAGLERQRGDGGAELAGGRGDLADEGGDDVGHGRGVVVGRV